MESPYRRAGGWLAGVALCLALLAPSARADGSARGEPPHAEETFEFVWQKLRSSRFDEGRDSIDWTALEATHRPAITGAGDLPALRREINRLLQAVGVSHLALIPSEAVPGPKRKSRPRAPEGQADVRADVGLQVSLLEGGVRVARVLPGSAAAEAGIGTGWTVGAIDDWRMDEVLASLGALPEGRGRQLARLQFELHANGRLEGLVVGETVALKLRDGRGREREATLAARPSDGTPLRLVPGMPEETARYSAARVPLDGGGCALQVAFNVWAQPAYQQLVASLREHARCDRLVLDLRGNPGGQIWTITAIAGLLYDKPTQLGTMSTDSGRLNLAVLPRRVADDGSPLRTLHGPVAVLIDHGSASSSEIFAGGLQATGRARVFGDTSAGMALPAITARLPSGDWLYYPTADMTDPGGRRIEGAGVQPDQAARASVADLLAGRDLALEAALAWLSEPASDTAP